MESGESRSSEISRRGDNKEEISWLFVTPEDQTDDTDRITVFKWPHEAILLLLEEHNLRQNDFTSGIISHKRIWALIAGEMIRNGYNVTGPQCLSKFSGLKRTYKSIRAHNNKSGPGSKSWPYFYHMDNLMRSVSPVPLTLSSTRSRRANRSRSDYNGSNVNEKHIILKRPREVTSVGNEVEKLVEELKEERRISEEAAEKRHRENVALSERLLQSFDKMIDLLTKKNEL